MPVLLQRVSFDPNFFSAFYERGMLKEPFWRSKFTPLLKEQALGTISGVAGQWSGWASIHSREITAENNGETYFTSMCLQMYLFASPSFHVGPNKKRIVYFTELTILRASYEACSERNKRATLTDSREVKNKRPFFLFLSETLSLSRKREKLFLSCALDTKSARTCINDKCIQDSNLSLQKQHNFRHLQK